MRSNKYQQTHLDTGRRKGSDEHPYMIAACGYEAWSERSITTEEGRVSCPTCLGVIHRRLLAERPADAPKLELIKPTEASGTYRFSYKAMLGGEHVGFVAYDGGYGRASWRVCMIALPDPKRPWDKSGIGYQLDRDPANERTLPLSYATKEEALLAIPELRAAGRLKTHAELTAQAAEWKRREAAWEVEKAAKAVQLTEDRETMLAGVESLLARGDLTNLERAAVVLLQRYIPRPREG